MNSSSGRHSKPFKFIHVKSFKFYSMQYIHLLTSGIKPDVGNPMQVHHCVRLKTSKHSSGKEHRCCQCFACGEKEIRGLWLHWWPPQPHSGCSIRGQEVTEHLCALSSALHELKVIATVLWSIWLPLFVFAVIEKDRRKKWCIRKWAGRSVVHNRTHSQC